MKLQELDLSVGRQFDRDELRGAFDRGMTGRGIEICYDSEDQRYLRLFSRDDGPYSDEISGSQFTYIGEGRTGDQERKAGNKALVESMRIPLPIFFFHKGSDDEAWEYQGRVEVIDYEYGYHDPEGRKVFQFTLRRAHEEDEPVDEHEGVPDIGRPERVETTRSRVVRNTSLVDDLKSRYGHQCQVCGSRRFRTPEEPYAEGHHLQPLGHPHDGPDVASNLLVLCPNHHADFDYGMIELDPDTYRIAHAYDASVDGDHLRVAPTHELDSSFVEYHNRWIADF